LTAAAAAASTPAPRVKRFVRRRRHLHGEGDGVNADAQSAKERPFDHMANAVGTGKRLIQMELLLPWMERHLGRFSLFYEPATPQPPWSR
jgi:hypothetical protein